jgi:hypothetical protein
MTEMRDRDDNDAVNDSTHSAMSWHESTKRIKRIIEFRGTASIFSAGFGRSLI